MSRKLGQSLTLYQVEEHGAEAAVGTLVSSFWIWDLSVCSLCSCRSFFPPGRPILPSAVQPYEVDWRWLIAPRGE